MLLSAIVRLALLSAVAPPPADTIYSIASDGSVLSADTVPAMVPDEPEIAKWPAKRSYQPGEEVLVAAHFNGGGFVVDHRVGDPTPLPEILAWTDRPQYDVGDMATVFVQTGRIPGYVMVFQVDDDGTGHILFPRTPGEDNYLRAEQTIALPGSDESGTFAVASATGTGLLYAVISRDHFDPSRLQDANGWKNGAIRISASPSAAASGQWGRLFWQMKDVAKGVTTSAFNSHLLSYSVVNPPVARRRLFATQTLRQCAEPYSYYDGDWCPSDPTKQIPCVILHDGMVLFGDACDWYYFSLRFAADRAAWCAETHNPISCAGLPPSDSGSKAAGVTPPTHHLGGPFEPKPIAKDESSPWNRLASAPHPAPKPPPAEPPTYATGVFPKKSDGSSPQSHDPFAPAGSGSVPNMPRSGGSSTPHGVDPGFAPPSTVAQRPEPPRSTGGNGQAPPWKDHGSSSAPSANGGGSYEAPQSSGGGGMSYDPSPSSGGGASRPDPSPQSQTPSYSPPDHTNAGNPPGSAPPPAPGRPPAS